jgi:hypothetical protein
LDNCFSKEGLTVEKLTGPILTLHFTLKSLTPLFYKKIICLFYVSFRRIVILEEIVVMTTKLTLSIKEEIVKKAKRISLRRGKSVSKLIEEYITSLPEKDDTEENAIDKIKKIMQGKITDREID